MFGVDGMGRILACLSGGGVKGVAGKGKDLPSVDLAYVREVQEYRWGSSLFLEDLRILMSLERVGVTP